MKTKLIALSLIFASTSSFSAEIPAPGKHDKRVRYITYKSDEVTVAYVKRGAVTRIVLNKDETIEAAATGFPGACDSEDTEWCIDASKGSNQVWVKPKENATHNNLELKTDKRDYSFEFNVLADIPSNSEANANTVIQNNSTDPMFRVIFKYPEPPQVFKPLAVTLAMKEQSEKNKINKTLRNSFPNIVNSNYSMEILDGSDEITPSMVFDDGRFTYFQFPANREIPSIYYISPNEEEERINFHMDDDIAVVERMGKRFVLRLGKAVVGVWNDSYDPNGIPAKTGVTVDGVIRKVKAEENL